MVNEYEKTIDTYLLWMLQMIDKIERYTHDIKSYDDFQKQEIIMDAVITPLTQLGEISNQIKKLNYAPFEKKLPLKEMNEMRNFLVHTYHKIDFYYVWMTIQNSLPTLKEKVKKMIIEK
jgi:uncharacterized protein with HEPN domain